MLASVLIMLGIKWCISSDLVVEVDESSFSIAVSRYFCSIGDGVVMCHRRNDSFVISHLNV